MSEKEYDNMEDVVTDLRNEFFPDCDFVQTSPCGRGEYHPRGLVGKLWRIKDPETVRVGHCFLQGRLKSGDLFLCINHSGDNFQDYIFIEKYSNGYRGRPQWEFGSYNIGDAEQVDYPKKAFDTLVSGGFYNT